MAVNTILNISWYVFCKYADRCGDVFLRISYVRLERGDIHCNQCNALYICVYIYNCTLS